MPYYETVEQKLPLGFYHQGVWYDTAIVREKTGGDNQFLVGTEAAQNYIKAQHKLLAALILGFKNSGEGESRIDRVTPEMTADMFIADRDMCYLASRKLTYGNLLLLRFTCSYCGDKIEFDYDLDMQDVKWSEDFPPSTEWSVELPRGLKVHMNDPETYRNIILQQLRGRDQEKVVQNAKIDRSKAATTAIWCAIKDIVGVDPGRKNLQLIDNMRSIDYDFIQRALADNRFGPTLQADFICGNCQTSNSVPLGPSMFSAMA